MFGFFIQRSGDDLRVDTDGWLFQGFGDHEDALKFQLKSIEDIQRTLTDEVKVIDYRVIDLSPTGPPLTAKDIRHYQ